VTRVVSLISRWYSIAAIVVCTLLSLPSHVGAQIADPDSQGATPQPAESTNEARQGYPEEQQPVVGPTDAEVDLDKTFPKRDSVIGVGVPQEYFDWKEEVYDRIGLKFGVYYQQAFMNATETAPFASFESAWGDWWGVNAKWTLLNRGEDFEGSLVVVAAERRSIGDNAVPAQYGALDVGSLYPVNFGFTSWPFAIEELYWEQWIENSAVVRAGITAAGAAMNPFRFKDDRTSFSATPFAFHESIPAPAQGPGFAVKWWPIEDSEFYVTGVLNDVNGNPNNGSAGIDLNSFFKREFFYAWEFGYVWRREGGEFDRLFLDLFYADERSTRDPDVLLNKAGGGFKIMGEKQLGPWVVFGSYTFNTAEGGSTSVSLGRHTVTAGGAYLSPLGIRGEIGMGMIWMKPHDVLPSRNQLGFEAYWKILFTPNAWVTPGIQFIHHPSLNPTVENLAIPQIKFSAAF